MQAESITALEGFGSEVIPVEYFLSVDDSQRVRTQDAVTIAELGKQLLLSAKNGETEQVRDLMCRGAPFTTDWLGTSALHLAAQGNHLDTAIALLRAGISKDARTKVDRTPLHMAAYEGHNEMAVLLLKEGADVDSKDMLKMTPLHWAVENDHQEVILTLLEKGADPNVVSKFDKTPISLALEHNRLDFVELMQQEREILALRAQQQRDFQIQLHNQLQSQENSAEIEEATHSLMQIEAERQQEQQLQQQQFAMQQVQQKRKLAQGKEVQAVKKPRMVFQQIHSSPLSEDEQEKQLEFANRINSITNNPYRKQKEMVGFGGLNQPYRILEAHGITMIPNESDGSIVGNAMESGGTVVLTEAGKMALNLTGANKLNVTRIQVGARRGVGKKIITLARADQFLGQNTQTLTSRGPNILKRNASDNKTGKYFLAPIGNNSTTVTTVKATSSKKSVNESPRKIVKPMLLQLDDEIEEITEDTNSNEDGTEQVMDVALLNRKLAEARRLNADYRKQLQKKEEEAEIYKQQLRNITAQNTAK